MPADGRANMIRNMNEPAPKSARYSVKRYFELAKRGVIARNDRVELLEGLIVAMAPQTSPHAATAYRVGHALQRKLGPDKVVRVQMSFLAGSESAPEPDVAVVPGKAEDFCRRHPTRAHLVVEVAETSVIQDRITKAAIYARAGVPCYWIVNVRDRHVETFREPDRWRARYGSVMCVTGSDTLTIDAFPDIAFTAAEMLPPSPRG